MIQRASAGLAVGIWLLVLVSASVYGQTPTITSITPNPVGVGQSVIISGSNFGSSGSVTFSGKTATTTAWASNSITATVPANATNGGKIVVTANGKSSNGFVYGLNNGPVNYYYDDLGRLVGVIDVNSNAAEYSYDAVGNILAISRYTSSQVSIINFSPDTGPTGTQVTINGTGFSSTASQNTVTFNGVAATVSKAAKTQLIAVVPSSATSGPIEVTSPNGSATSSASFTVTSGSGVPTITSFSPTSGVAGNAVTVTGTNFDPTLANDELRLNATPAVVSSVVPTSISTTVPSATASGHFKLVAPAGIATSSQDFYIPFLTHVAGDIGFTKRITLPASQKVTLAANKIALVLFDATAGQELNLSLSGSTFSSCTLYLIAPDNTNGGITTTCTGSQQLPSIVLTKSGTYTIGIDPSSSSGSVTVSLNMDFVGQLVLPAPGNTGPAVQVPTTGTLSAGQNGLLTFDVTTPGDKVSLHLGGAALGNSSTGCTVELYNQEGSQLTGYYCGTNTFTFADLTYAVLSPETYSVVVVASGSSLSVALDNDQDVTGPPITIGGTSTVGTTVEGQDVRLSFQASAGQQIALEVNNVSNPEAYVHVIFPDGTEPYAYLSINPNPPPNPGYFFWNTEILTETGLYQLWVQHLSNNFGGETLQLFGVPQNISQVLTVNGSQYSFSTVVGQDANFQFTISNSESVTVHWTNGTYPSSPGCNLTVTGPAPSTTQVGSGNCNTTTGSVALGTLSPGTYNILVAPQYASTGGMSIYVTTP